MLYTIPDYYHQFHCIADRCEDTCCAGWQISADKKSLKKYKNVQGAFRKRLHRSIRWKDGTFRQSHGKRCAFLNEENLCDMYTALGKDCLCKTCRLYPRHIEEFENVREISLSVSCPEAARLLLTKTEPVQFLSFEKEKEEEYEDFDLFLYSMLVDARELMVKILQNREKNLDVRTGLVLGIAHDLQLRINRSELFSCDEVFQKYQTTAAEKFIKKKLPESYQNNQEYFSFIRQMFKTLYGLEHLRDDWNSCLRKSENCLYRKGAKEYFQTKTKFNNWQKEHMPNWEIQCEQLLVYFLTTYFCGAVYDAQAYVKVQMSVISVLLIHELLMAKWLMKGKTLNFHDLVQTVYRYSRELEHSEPNLNRMEEMMSEQPLPWFSA